MDDNMNTRPAAENEVRLSAAEPMQETANKKRVYLGS